MGVPIPGCNKPDYFDVKSTLNEVYSNFTSGACNPYASLRAL